MKTKIVNYLIAGAVAIGAAACTDNYGEINSNPYQPGDLTADDYVVGSVMNNMAGCVVSPDVNTTQFTECLMAGPFCGYYADSNEGFNDRALSRFIPRDDWGNVLLRSDRIIPVLYSNLAIVQDVVKDTHDSIPLAVATVIKVATMSRVTDAYGPIPYTKIGKDGKISIPYDSQEAVYDKFFEELTWATTFMRQHPGAALTASADYVYSGDISKWIRFGNSLKLRLAMRISNVAPDKAKKFAEEAVAPANGGLIENNSQNAQWNYFGATQNPLYVASRYNQAADCKTGGDSHAAADLICYMNGYNDARRSKYFVPSEWATSGPQTYVGLRHGIVIPANSVTRKYSGINVAPSDPLQWMNAAEVAFLRAEGAAIHGFEMGGDAKKFYEDGIKLSFEQYGVDGAQEYMAQGADALPGTITYKDPANINTFNGAIKLIPVKWDEGATADEKLERIMVQKWIANWQNANEAWAEIRRTGFPVLLPATGDGNASGGIVDSQRGRRRLPYPLDEYTSNAANVQQAVSEYLAGPDNMATDLWWAKKK